MFQRVWLGLIDLLAPPGCAACDAPLAQRDLGFCQGCDGLLDEAGLDPAGVDQACFLYGGPLADAISRFKYSGRSDLAPALAARMLSRACSFAGRVDVVTCVPLHRSRLIARAFNQSALLARPIAARLGVRFRPEVVVRTRATSAQAGLGRTARLRNLSGAFAARASVAGLRVLVVDDVSTTNSTMFAVRQALEAAEAASVMSLVLARTENGVEDGVY